MKLLLDTHTLLWWLGDDDRLGPKPREMIIDPANDVFASAVSLWEIVVKMRVWKLQADIDEISEAIDQQGFILLGISRPHLLTLVTLPMHHRDPFDHLLISQAIAERATFVSDDRNALKYPVDLVACAGNDRS